MISEVEEIGINILQIFPTNLRRESGCDIRSYTLAVGAGRTPAFFGIDLPKQEWVYPQLSLLSFFMYCRHRLLHPLLG